LKKWIATSFFPSRDSLVSFRTSLFILGFCGLQLLPLYGEFMGFTVLVNQVKGTKQTLLLQEERKLNIHSFQEPLEHALSGNAFTLFGKPHAVSQGCDIRPRPIPVADGIKNACISGAIVRNAFFGNPAKAAPANDTLGPAESNRIFQTSQGNSALPK
jgi:hypothetical protein